jgi:hypothetical protein
VLVTRGMQLRHAKPIKELGPQEMITLHHCFPAMPMVVESAGSESNFADEDLLASVLVHLTELPLLRFSPSSSIFCVVSNIHCQSCQRPPIQ